MRARVANSRQVTSAMITLQARLGPAIQSRGWPFRATHAKCRSVQSVRDSSVDEPAARITVGDVVSPDEVVGRGRIVRVGRIAIQDVLRAQRELERMQTRIGCLHIEGIVRADLTENSGDRRGAIMVSLLIV